MKRRQDGDEYKQDSIKSFEDVDESKLKLCFGPKCFLNIKWVVFWLCVIGFIEGAAVNGFVNIVLTTLEKRFNLSSSQSSLIVSSTDIGAVVVVLFVSFYAAQKNRAVVVGIGTLVMACGSFIFLIPHFASEPYDYQGANVNSTSKICDVRADNTCTAPSQTTNSFLYVLMLAQFVHGIGFTPVFTLGTAYVDDNARSESTAVYLGLIYALTALGVAAGFVAGGQFLNLWIDFNRIDTTYIYNTFTPTDPIWIGAWWLGFIVTCIAFFVAAIPMFAYPHNLPGTAAIRAARLSEKDNAQLEKQKSDIRPLRKKILDFPKAIITLLKIPCFDVIVFAACAETLIIGGLSAFAPKILEEKFDVNPSNAGLIMGAVTIGGGAGGMVLGGVLIKSFKLQFRGMTNLCSLLALIALLIGAGFFINCDEQAFAGLSMTYSDGSTSTSSISSFCNAACGCTTTAFEPVCGSDGMTYFSACHAGCNVSGVKNLTTLFDDKGYVPLNGGYFDSVSFLTIVLFIANIIVWQLEWFFKTKLHAQFSDCSCIGSFSNGTATSGECSSSCDIYIVFVILLFLAMLCTFTTVTPASMAILRCVPDEHRAVGLGLQWVLLRLLGTIPGPVLTGAVLDTSCDVWQYTCDVKGSCWVYDRSDMSWKLFLWWCIVKVISCGGFFIGGRIYKPSNNENTTDNNSFITTKISKDNEKVVSNGDYDVNFGNRSYTNLGFQHSEKSSVRNLNSTHM